MAQPFSAPADFTVAKPGLTAHPECVPKVAEILRRGREAKGLTVYQVAELTKIKTEHVRALEDGNYQAFPAPIFIKGFVRNYAAVLKLNTAEVLATLESELAQTERFREPPSLTGEPHSWLDWVTLQLSKVNWRWVAPVFLLAALVASGLWGYRAWRDRPVRDPLRQLGPGLYTSRRHLPAVTLPLPAPSPVAPAASAGKEPR